LEVAVVARRLQAGAAELGGDVFAGDIEAPRGRAAAFERIGSEEGDVGLQRVGRDAVGKLGGQREGRGQKHKRRA